MELKKYFDLLKESSGNKAKAIFSDMLKEYPSFIQFISMVISPYYTLGVTELSLKPKKNNTLFDDDNEVILSTVLKLSISKLFDKVYYYDGLIDIITEFNERNYTGNEARSVLLYVKSLAKNSFDSYLFDCMIKKSFEININKKIFNTTLKEIDKKSKWIIPDDICMLAENTESGNKRVKYNYEYIVDDKRDGVRTICKIYPDGSFDMLSRTGKKYVVFEEYFKKEIKKIYEQNKDVYKDIYLLDGEMMSESNDFDEVVGLGHSKHLKIQDMNIVYNLFDFFIPSEYIEQESNNMTQINRKKQLDLLNLNEIDNIKVVKYIFKSFKDKEDLITYTKERIDKGFEGIMLKEFEGEYLYKRSKNWLKVKLIDTIDLKIVDFVEGTGKIKNALGAMIVEDIKGKRVGIGTGFTEKQRKDIWKNKNEYINKIAEIKYQNKTKDKSLRFPSFSKIRELKETADEI